MEPAHINKAKIASRIASPSTSGKRHYEEDYHLGERFAEVYCDLLTSAGAALLLCSPATG
jgi:hypothetical protein